MTAPADVTEPGEDRARPAAENLINALEHIRIAALLHYVGGAFDPEHMRSICNLASDALDGKEIPPLPDPEQVRARTAAWAAMIEELMD